MLQKKQTKIGKALSFVVCLLLILMALAVIYFRQRIIDQITIFNFSPSAEIIALTDRIDLSDEGKFIFYASQPELDDASTFNDYCVTVENTASILGCYSSYRIYIYNVTDARLDGIREVTAAHEMLHAAYERLSQSQKEELSPLLEAEYLKLISNQDFADLMAFYSQAEPGERQNELHSIIGTVASNISPELETYYSQYFINRKTIVEFDTAYNKVFKDLSNQAKDLSQKLNKLAASIPTDSKGYNSMVQALNADIASFNSRAQSGSFSTWAEFYSEKNGLESRVDQLNITREQINTDISNYNLILEQYNSIAIESQNLYKSINSTLVEAGSL